MECDEYGDLSNSDSEDCDVKYVSWDPDYKVSDVIDDDDSEEDLKPPPSKVCAGTQ